MTLIQYESFNFRNATLHLIELANEIISEYQADGFTLTLRQLYYQLVSRDIIPNSEKSYDCLGQTITKARLAGMISWDAIEDRGRGIRPWLIEEDEANIFKDIEYQFALDYWARQSVYVEVWVEKEALSSVIKKPCGRWRVPYMPCKGYLSASEAWRAGRRFLDKRAEGNRCVMIHLGDHDPSGIDMTRDNLERLQQFSEGAVDVRRIALNMDQVRQYKPPPNPAKMTDTRASDYVANFGQLSWELDALTPRVLDSLIDKVVRKLVNMKTWDETQEEEDEARKELRKLHPNWPEVRGFLETLDEE